MLITNPLFIVTPEYENMNKIIEGSETDTITSEQVIFLVGDVTLNGQLTVLGQMVII